MAIYLIDKLKPMPNGKFPLIDAEDVQFKDGTNLEQKIINTTQGVVPYVLIDVLTGITYPTENEMSFALTQEDWGKVMFASEHGCDIQLFEKSDFIVKIENCKIVGVDLCEAQSMLVIQNIDQPPYASVLHWKFKKTIISSVETQYTAIATRTGIQNELISGENIKTINGQSILGSGNIEVVGGDNTPITTEVVCNHKYEITGNTGDEHGLAVEDQQMLIKKIQGQTKAIDLKINTKFEFIGNTKGYSQAFYINNFTLFKEDTDYTVLINSKVGGMQFYLASNTFEWHPMEVNVGLNIFNVKTKKEVLSLTNILVYNLTDNTGKLDASTITELYFYEGKHTLETLPYGLKLVNSNNILISSGRNLFSSSSSSSRDANLIITNNSIEYVGPYNVERISILCKNYNEKNNVRTSFNEIKTIPLDCEVLMIYFVIKEEFISIEYPMIKFRGLNFGIYCDASSDNKSLTNVRFVYQEAPYEPFIEEKITSIGEMGEWDYIEGNNKVTRTIINTYKGSLDENWIEETQHKLTSTNLFVIDLKEIQHKTIKNSINNQNYEVASDILNIDKRGIAIIDNKLYVRDNFTDLNSFKANLTKHNLEVAYCKNETIITEVNLPSGYAVYNGGLQSQEGLVPYKITKQYNLNQKAQILANIEIDREQANMITNKQDALVSGTNIKTINGQSLLGQGDITIQGGVTSVGYASAITINQPNTAMQGNLTQEDLTILQANDQNYIVFANEIYRLQDKTHTSDTYTYAHVGYENGKHWIKTISITISTLAWVLNKTSIGGA